MMPDRPLDQPFDNAPPHIRGGREEERRQQRNAGNLDGGERVPEQHRDHRDQNLQRQEAGAGHADTRALSRARSCPAYKARRPHGLENVPMIPVAPLAWPSSAFMSSSRVMPLCNAVGSRSVAISV